MDAQRDTITVCTEITSGVTSPRSSIAILSDVSILHLRELHQSEHSALRRRFIQLKGPIRSNLPNLDEDPEVP